MTTYIKKDDIAFAKKAAKERGVDPLMYLEIMIDLAERRVDAHAEPEVVKQVAAKPDVEAVDIDIDTRKAIEIYVRGLILGSEIAAYDLLRAVDIELPPSASSRRVYTNMLKRVPGLAMARSNSGFRKRANTLWGDCQVFRRVPLVTDQRGVG